MTDAGAQQPPFPGFPGFPPAEMLDKMWDMMRLTPFGSAFPGMQPGAAQGIPSPLSAMSDMMTPLMSVEELDKRITDMRAVEQWLKLNLNMLQSAIQALEVQRATLSTLRAFGAFAQASMSQPPQSESPAKEPGARASGWGAAKPASEASAAASGAQSGAEPEAEAQTASGAGGAFDPTGWWNLLQTQFNQLASFAMAQPAGEAAAAEKAEGGSGGDPSGTPGVDTRGEGSGPKAAGASRGGPDGKPAARAGEGRTKTGASQGASKAAGSAARSPSAKPAAKRGAAGNAAGATAGGGASPPHDE
jgi:hypothetical protein